MSLILLFRQESEVDLLKSVCVQASEELHMLTGNAYKKSACVQAPLGLHVPLGPPAAADVREAKRLFSTADRFFVGAGTCASSNCSLYTTNGMLQTGFKPVDTNRCVCK
ncbi:hypothetical protein AVEN_125344-1 [Araneus ventricosus]|uniref:Uncharacterized protein n=1 Tax=Araneus ventricosus TaxID=182803 RepID=A0A4Y2IDW8_ARAVE|nr:hypothetical protein AVEN_125344-1 [Araneus ventricosus]